MVTTISAEQLVRPVADDIRRLAAQAEAERRMPAELMAALRDAGLFSIYTPRQFGGLGLPLPEALSVVEEVSRHDGSTGWTVALGFTTAALTPGLGDDAATMVCGNGSVLVTGAPAFGVRARPVDGGYSLTGRWSFNSGAPNADWISAAAPIFDGDEPRIGPDGQPQLIFCFMRPADVQIIDTWHVTGLRATGTQDLYVEDVFVPAELAGPLTIVAGPAPMRDSVLSNIPFISLLGMVQSPPVCLGLARRAIEEFRTIAGGKQGAFGGPGLGEQPQTHVAMARAEALLRSARTYWYDSVQTIWDIAASGQSPSIDDRMAMRLASLTAVENAVAAVDLVHRLSGTTAIFQSSALERCWRDIHTAAQHLQVQEGRWETAGRVLFGLAPNSPIL